MQANAGRQAAWHGIAPEGGRPFLKMHGLRNHFVIVDGRDAPYAPDAREVARICDVQIGVGADQVLILQRSRVADAYLRILNIDGREVAACGNATRCAAWLLLEETGRDKVALETGAGVLTCRRAGAMQVAVEMGRITHDWRAIPLARDVDTLDLPLEHGPLSHGIAASIGNPHVTFFVPDLAALDVAALARPVLCDPLFPEQVNVGLAEVTGPASLRLQAYERPGLLTGACGTGACVAAHAARLRGLVGAGAIRVEMGAGAVTVELSEAGDALMTGPVGWCYAGRLPGEGDGVT